MKRKHIKYFQECHYAIAIDRIHDAITWAILSSGVPTNAGNYLRKSNHYYQRYQLI